MPLTDAAVRNAKPREKVYKLSDGSGLYLLVQPTGSRLWRMKYRFEDKEKLLAFGAYPDVGLSAAREKRQAARAQLDQGQDPSAARKATRNAWGVAPDRAFHSVARDWFRNKERSIVSGYAARIWSRLEGDIFPFRYIDPNNPDAEYPPMGEMDVAKIEPPMLLAAVRVIEARGAIELAKRVKNTCGEIFRFAIAEGKAQRDPSADIRNALAKRPPTKGRAALKEADVPLFFNRLAAYDGGEQTRLALRLTLQTVVRTEEIRFAPKSEFENLDGPEPLWRVAKERMKMRRDHLVPLAPQAVATVRALMELAPASEMLLPADTKSGVISENTMIYALYRMGFHSRATVHGFRKTFSTIANESGLWEADWIEMQLAHADSNQVRAIYNAAQWLPQRRRLMAWWADQLDAKERLSALLG